MGPLSFAVQVDLAQFAQELTIYRIPAASHKGQLILLIVAGFEYGVRPSIIAPPRAHTAHKLNECL